MSTTSDFNRNVNFEVHLTWQIFVWFLVYSFIAVFCMSNSYKCGNIFMFVIIIELVL